MKVKRRLSHIDLLESIAIFFVVIYHSTIYSYDFSRNSNLINYILYFGRTILSTCVPLFFFANGYLLFNKPFDLNKHIKKIVRLIMLILIWSFLLMPTYMLIEGQTINIKTVVTSILNMDTRWSMNLFWFLGALICIYVLFPALKVLFDTNRKAFVFFTVVCAFLTFGFVLGNQLLAFFSTLLKHNIGNMKYPLLTMFNPFRGSYGYSFVYFCVGGLICTCEDKILSFSKVRRNIISILGLFVSCGCLALVGIYYSIFYDGKLWDVVWNGYDTIFTFFNVLFIYTLCLNYSINNKFINYISCNTLGIYFTHGLFIRLTRPLICSYDILCNLPVNLLYAFSIVCACLLVCILLKKIPILKKMV